VVKAGEAQRQVIRFCVLQPRQHDIEHWHKVGLQIRPKVC
jgi:hypothetical protein